MSRGQDGLKKRKVALVLSGGGAKGAYQAGVIRHLARTIPHIDMVCGSSVGAINGAVLAEGLERGDPCAAADSLCKAWVDQYGALAVNVREMTEPTQMKSIFQNTRIRDMIRKHIPPSRRMSHYTRTELVTTAVNLNTGVIVAFDRGSDVPVEDAVLASSAIPVLYQSYVIGHDYYVDAGLFYNTPVREAISRGAQDVIVVSLSPSLPHSGSGGSEAREGGAMEQFDTAAKVAVRIFELAAERLLKDDIDMASQVNVLEIAPSQTLDPPGSLGFANKKAIVDVLRMGETDASRADSALRRIGMSEAVERQ